MKINEVTLDTVFGEDKKFTVPTKYFNMEEKHGDVKIFGDEDDKPLIESENMIVEVVDNSLNKKQKIIKRPAVLDKDSGEIVSKELTMVK